jgi:iron complex transport system ATP-binding protein
MISASGLSIGYRKGKSVNKVQTNLNLSATEGSLVAILGPNGCGKSTLLRTLAGILDPLEGTVQVQHKPLHTLSLEERAKQMSLVLTDAIQVVYMTVRDLVAMGRHPYTTLFGHLTDHDKTCVDKALEAVHMTAFDHRYVQELSDGERQRVMIAKALAQDTPLVLLDEPTSHLDLPNRIETILLLRELTNTWGKTVLLSTHEIDLALRLADSIWLMDPSGGVTVGTPAALMQSGRIQAVFHSENFGFEAETGRVIIF